jgi:orotidine-5'-phosphate decarboxylase
MGSGEGRSLHWGDIVQAKVRAFGPLVLGIDPAVRHSPGFLTEESDRFLERYTATLLNCAFGKIGVVKFQSAFFEALGCNGINALARGIGLARELGFSVILDAKRGDIASTAEAYAQGYLTPPRHGGSDLEVDCLTVNPFLGPDSVEPFIDCSRHYGKGVVILVKTSNPGSGWLQDEASGSASASEKLAVMVDRWAAETVGTSGTGAVGALIGATYPSEAQRLRQLLPRSVILAPGLGVQGGDGKALSRLATATGPVLVSVSRGIAAVNDPGLGPDEYRSIVCSRIDDFRDALVSLPLDY